MNRNVFAVVLTAVMLVGAVGAVPAGALSDDSGGLSYAGNDTAPGEQFAGSVSVGEAEVENDMETRAFDHRLNQAENDSERAAAIAEELDESEAKLEALREQREALKTATENGEISEREYRVRTAKLAAQLSGVEEIANRSESAAAGIPNETLAANGVDVERIKQLRSSASELRGGEVAEIARNIAGANAGSSPGEPPSEAANRSADGGPEEGPSGSDAGEAGQDGEGTETGDSAGSTSGDDATSENGTATEGTESSTDTGDDSSSNGDDGTDDGSSAGTETDDSTTEDEPTETEQA